MSLLIICWTKDQRPDDNAYKCVDCGCVCYNRTAFAAITPVCLACYRLREKRGAA